MAGGFDGREEGSFCELVMVENGAFDERQGWLQGTSWFMTDLASKHLEPAL